ncbi:MAG: enoyl-CoA hydratase-related protein [Phycisphaerae bacterium]|jgi:2-(1,2-epoxy-1,2-dihydrophenyl)acetyl-CoA isomerase
MVEEDTILLRHEEGARYVVLNRPEVLNAFNEPMLVALLDAVRAAAAEESVRCLVLTGAGRAFSSGQDLAVVRDRYAGGGTMRFDRLIRQHYNPVITAIRTMEKPVIASVNGIAAGAGCSLALACDLRIAAESAAFMQAFVNVGLVPDAGSSFMLPRLIGIARAMELAFTGRRVSAGQALALGMVNDVVADDMLGEKTGEWAQKLARMPTRAIGLAKKALNAAWNSELPEQLDREAECQGLAEQTRDHREGVAAFVEKRLPRFEGR